MPTVYIVLSTPFSPLWRGGASPRNRGRKVEGGKKGRGSRGTEQEPMVCVAKLGKEGEEEGNLSLSISWKR